MRAALTAILLSTTTTMAHADELGLPEGAVEAALTLESDQSAYHPWEPWSLAPDLWAGVTSRLTLGVTHSARALGLVDSGGGLCLAGAAHGCEAIYATFAVDARWRLGDGDLAAAAHAGYVQRDGSPWKPALRYGAVVRLRAGRFAVVADPQVQLGLWNVERGNRARLELPVWLRAGLGGGVALTLWTGVHGELQTFADTFAIPLGGELGVAIGARVDVGAGGGFPAALGPQNDRRPRHAWLRVAVRWP